MKILRIACAPCSPTYCRVIVCAFSAPNQFSMHFVAHSNRTRSHRNSDDVMFANSVCLYVRTLFPIKHTTINSPDTPDQLSIPSYLSALLIACRLLLVLQQ